MASSVRRWQRTGSGQAAVGSRGASCALRPRPSGARAFARGEMPAPPCRLAAAAAAPSVRPTVHRACAHCLRPCAAVFAVACVRSRFCPSLSVRRCFPAHARLCRHCAPCRLSSIPRLASAHLAAHSATPPPTASGRLRKRQSGRWRVGVCKTAAEGTSAEKAALGR